MQKQASRNGLPVFVELYNTIVGRGLAPAAFIPRRSDKCYPIDIRNRGSRMHHHTGIDR